MSDASDLRLSRIVFGSMGYRPAPEKDQIRVIHCAIDHGLTTIDTAPLYGFGESERIIGRAIRDRRDRVQIATKCGLRWDGDHGQIMFSAEIDGATRAIRKDSRSAALRRDIEQSLRRLGVETLDLVHIHELDYDTPIESTLDTLRSLRSEGKIRKFGVSNFPLDACRKTHTMLGQELYSTQNLFNMLERDTSNGIKELARAERFNFIAYSALAQGVLAGKQLDPCSAPTDWRKDTANYHPDNIARVNRVLRSIAIPLAETHGLSLAQLALLWTLAQPGITHVIAGATTEQQVRDNAHVLETSIPSDALDRLGMAMADAGWNPMPGISIVTRVGQRLRRALRGWRRS